MKAKNLIFLIVFAVVLVGIAVKTSEKNSKSVPDIVGKPVFPELAVDQIEKIAISSHEGTATVAIAGDIWVAPDRYNHPADFSKVKDYLVKLSNLNIGQVMKLTDKQKADLRIVPPSATGKNTGTLVEMYGKGNSVLASVLIGEARMKKPAGEEPDYYGGFADGQYLSSDGGKSVYLVNTAFNEMPLTSQKWLDADIVNVMSSDIKEITIAGPGRKDVKLLRKSDGSPLEVEGIATNEVTAASKIYSVESALTYFKMDDLADPMLGADKTGLDKPIIFKAVTQKGETYSAKIGGKKEGTDYRYCKLEVTLKEAEKQQAPKDDAEKKKQEETAKARKELEDKTKSLNDKLVKWTYLIASQKVETMTPLRETLIEKKQEEKKEDGKQPGGTDTAGNSENKSEPVSAEK